MSRSDGQQALSFRLSSHTSGGALMLSQKRGSGPASRRATAATSCPSSVSFTTGGSSVACRKILRVGRGRPAPLPMASLSLAALTVSGKNAPAVPEEKKKKDLRQIFSEAGQKALRGGLPGMVAMGVQVLALMWMRTTINYQYRYGGTFFGTLGKLYAEGGIPRFYQGLAPALIQGPLSRFGDTAANTGTLALLEDVDIPVGIKTFAASASAGLFRIFLMPVDALKTMMQVEGRNGIPALISKVRTGGPTVLYHGALAASLATFVGHYPWFATYNTLDASLPQYDVRWRRLARSAFIGFCASFVSDCCSNSIRVVKTAKQTYTTPITYREVVAGIIKKDGVKGLFGRGLTTKLLSNGIQGIMFSVLWRLGQDYLAEQDKKKAAEAAVEEAAASKGKKK